MKLLSEARVSLRREVLWARHARNLQRLVREHPLRYLFLEVTRKCNLNCAYCGSNCTARGREAELPVEEWIRVVREVAHDFDAKDIMVAITGGEPLIKPGIFDLFAELHRLEFPFGMVTNASLLDDDAARRLVAAGMGSISISLDAPPEINDQLRGRGSWAKAEAAIRCLRAAGYRSTLEAISTISRPALAHLPELRRRLAEMRVARWRVAPVMPIGRAVSRPDLLLGSREIRQLLEFVLSARADKLLPVPEFCEEGYLGNRFEGNVRPYLAQCRTGITTGGILSDGRIGGCPELSEAFVQGDVRKESLRHVWETRYQNLRDRSWARTGECAICKEWARCLGGAMHLYEAPGRPPLRCLYWAAKASES